LSVRVLFRGILSSAFKSNSNLWKGVITGIHRLAKDDILSGLNNLSEYNLLS
jgi:hypothetical protein